MRFLDLNTEYEVLRTPYNTLNTLPQIRVARGSSLLPMDQVAFLQKIFLVGRRGQCGLDSGLIKLVHYFDTFQSAYLLLVICCLY
jgi:hypothetical protein